MERFLRQLLLPIARFCVRHGIVIQAIEAELRAALIIAAAEAMRTSELKVNASRLSVMTGLYREEIKKRLDEEAARPERPQSVIAQVVARWEQHAKYTSKAGKPRILSCGIAGSEFEQLVREISTYAGHAAVLVEMERKGIVERTPHGIKLLMGGEPFGDDADAAFEIVRDDIGSLIAAVEENLTRDTQRENLHIRTEYGNIYEDSIPQIRKWLIDQGKLFHRKARTYLSRFDKDISPRSDASKAGVKVSVTAFSSLPNIESIE